MALPIGPIGLIGLIGLISLISLILNASATGYRFQYLWLQGGVIGFWPLAFLHATLITFNNL